MALEADVSQDGLWAKKHHESLRPVIELLCTLYRLLPVISVHGENFVDGWGILESLLGEEAHFDVGVSRGLGLLRANRRAALPAEVSKR